MKQDKTSPDSSGSPVAHTVAQVLQLVADFGADDFRHAADFAGQGGALGEALAALAALAAEAERHSKTGSRTKPTHPAPESRSKARAQPKKRSAKKSSAKSGKASKRKTKKTQKRSTAPTADLADLKKAIIEALTKDNVTLPTKDDIADLRSTWSSAKLKVGQKDSRRAVARRLVNDAIDGARDDGDAEKRLEQLASVPQRSMADRVLSMFASNR